jgi:hypothetical protein
MYQLTDNPDLVMNLDTATQIPNSGNWQWQQYEDWLAEGNTPLPAPAPPEPDLNDAVAVYQVAVQAHLDTTAQTNGYDTMLSCVSYAGSDNEVFAADAKAGGAWRDAVWPEFYAMAQTWIDSGTAPDLWPPVEYVIEQLPKAVDFGWVVHPPVGQVARKPIQKV